MVRLLLILSSLTAVSAQAQIQLSLKFKRLQYIAYEPVIATLAITNLAGRDLELHDDHGQHWFGFEITDNAGRTLGALTQTAEPPLHVTAGTTVTREINLTPLYPVSDLGVYHVRANVYFSDLDKYFYAPRKVFEVTTAHPIWQRTVGAPAAAGASDERTYSLMTNRFPDHTSLYVRVEDRSNNRVYATYSLGRTIAFDEPHAEIDRESRLHVLQCSAPRLWTYSVIGLDGHLLQRTSYTQARSIPHLERTFDGVVTVAGGMPEAAAPSLTQKVGARLSTGSNGRTPKE